MANPYFNQLPPDPIAQAVDDYLLMERKARAWDELRKIAGPVVGVTSVALDRIWAEVHPAQEPSTR